MAPTTKDEGKPGFLIDNEAAEITAASDFEKLENPGDWIAGIVTNIERGMDEKDKPTVRFELLKYDPATDSYPGLKVLFGMDSADLRKKQGSFVVGDGIYIERLKETVATRKGDMVLYRVIGRPGLAGTL